MKYLGAGFSIPFIWLWVMMVKRESGTSVREQIILPVDNIPEGISFFGPVIVVRNKQGYTVFSSRCTHLGCTIDSPYQNRRMVCPCHGSVFNPDGEPEKGPATEHLQKLSFKLENGKIIIG